MRSIGQVLNTNYGDLNGRLAKNIEAARRRIEQDSADLRAKYGDDFDIEKCWHCGGRGVLPNGGKFCDKCEEGLRKSGADQYMRRWYLAVPSRFRDYRISSHPNREAADEVSRWVQYGMTVGQNLYLGGPVGTGKTGLGIAALWAAHQQDLKIRYTTVPDMLHRLRPMGMGEEINQVTLQELQSVDVLLLDDMGAEKSGAWPREQLYLVINGRYEARLPTILTSNLTLEELEDPDRAGDRPISRFAENCLPLWMDGDDLRQRRDIP